MDQILEQLRPFQPISAGPADAVLRLTLEGAKGVFPALSNLATSFGRSVVPERSPEDLCTVSQLPDANRLRDLFTLHGSDKASSNDYFMIYASIFSSMRHPLKIVEIGLGSNNSGIVSNMGGNGFPGSSLRAFRDFLPGAEVFGGDIDRSILFEEDRIKTCFVDQMNLATFSGLDSLIGDSVDLVIDDGLHSPLANLNTLTWALRKLRKGGWAVIEDIANYSVDIWKCVGMLSHSSRVRCVLVRVRSGHFLFCVNKVEDL